MIPQDIIKRVTSAHDNVVRAVLQWERAIPRTANKQNLYERYGRAEDRFEAAMAALVDAAR